jgi:hypothetical protein
MAKRSAKKIKTNKTRKSKSPKAKPTRRAGAKPVGNVRSQKEQIAERDLEEGLEETFPASDPVAASEPGPKE